MTLDETLAVVIARANELRAVGVRHLSIDGLAITLDPSEPVVTPDRTDRFPDEIDILADPATYGRLTGVPGFNRPPKDSE